eukprot:scaffold151728_cov28-Tisochrysis_lutea.AAC.3
MVTACNAKAAQPSAIPSSPGQGGTKKLAKPSSREIRPFTTEFSATPPPKPKFVAPVRSLSRPRKLRICASKSICTRAARRACIKRER